MHKNITVNKNNPNMFMCIRKLFSLEETANGWVDTQIQMCGSDVCFNGLSSNYERNILSFGEDDDGMSLSKPLMRFVSS